MYSLHHGALSLGVGAVVIYSLPSVIIAGIAVPTFVLIGYAVAIGVLIDLDHFLIARLKTGSWDSVWFCLAHPRAAVTDQRQIFEPGDVGVLSRLLSHLLIAGSVVPVLAIESVPLAVLTAAVLYAHVVSDVAWDIVEARQDDTVDVPEASKVSKTHD